MNELSGNGQGERGSGKRQPNVLIIMTDQMRWDLLSCAGHPICQTPVLDGLAERGVRFANFYTAAPICTPARYSIFNGRHVHVHDGWWNGLPTRDGEVFLPSIMQHYGYATAIAGKLHFDSKEHAFGFDDFRTFRSEGPTPERGYEAYLKNKYGELNRDRIEDGTCPWPDDPHGRGVGLFADPPEDLDTPWITRQTLEALDLLEQSGKPWFLFASYHDPHSPFVEPEPYYSMYDRESITLPDIPPETGALRRDARGTQEVNHLIDDTEMLREITAIYYAATTHVDHDIGIVLAELDRRGLTENTIIIFMSDHGDMMGDHGRMYKQVMYEGASHVPLIVQTPEHVFPALTPGRVVDEVTGHVDILPTVLDLCGLPVPQGVQGRSLAPLCAGDTAGWPNEAFSWMLGVPHTRQEAYMLGRKRMLRTPRYKLIDNGADFSTRWELFDMSDDPGEMHNLADDSAHTSALKAMAARLDEWEAEMPPLVKIPGMPTPSYSYISEDRRAALHAAWKDGLRRQARWRWPQ
ncbi:MAG: sulfatase-like hydrolase/transferase [Chloroflexota bacterium]|nr:sulfatase-like hydrolase/transferase [Chloroflexota bacterium]MDE2840039.1 sulfatase-like hydrolase/transferase [Chloroflexota bacterium]MDE2930306.1 sulfatase-like hydrolase/transferase [Chloroflexota bacterium]